MGGGLMKEDWHLDRKVPISLIIALAIQTGTAIWWASGMEHRVASTEGSVVRLKVEHDKIQSDVGDQSKAIAVLVEQLTSTNKSLEQLRMDVRDTNEMLRDLLSAKETP